MFQKKELITCGKQAVQYLHNSSEISMTVIPNRGAHLQSLIVEGRELVDGFRDENELSINHYSKSGFLYPFPNRLDHGVFEWDGTERKFPINDERMDNALHGFGMQDEFSIIQEELEDDKMTVVLKSDFDKKPSYYPWSFSVEIKYELNAKAELKVTMKATNTSDESIPFGMGWHPYFYLDKNSLETFLKLPEVEQVEVNDRMIPTGKLLKNDDFLNPTILNGQKFDTGFVVKTEDEECKTMLEFKNGKQLYFWQELGEGKFNFLQLYIPRHRESIAIEPMTCNIDAFNNKDGLAELAPGASIEAQCGISYV